MTQSAAAKTVAPLSPPVTSRLALAMHAAGHGDWAPARALLEQALQHTDERQQARFLLWEVCQVLGDPKAAVAHLRAAVILGAKTVRLDMGGRDAEMTNEQFDITASRFIEYTNFAADHGFRVGPENHFGPARVFENMDHLSRAVHHPAFGFLLHFGNWQQDPEASDRLLAPQVIHTHVDARTTATCLEERMTMLQQAGYQGCWGVEHHSAKNEYAEVAWQLAEVRRVLARQAA